jgi:hypothetical protein
MYRIGWETYPFEYAFWSNHGVHWAKYWRNFLKTLPNWALERFGTSSATVAGGAVGRRARDGHPITIL